MAITKEAIATGIANAFKSDIVAAVKAIMIPRPVSGITSDMVTKADMKADVASIKADMVTKADVASMKANMVTKADLANMKADMKADMVTKADFATMSAGMAKMSAGMAKMSAGMATSSEVAKVARTQDRLLKQIGTALPR